MSLDDELRGCSLKAHTSFDADNGVAHVCVASDGVRSSNLLYLLNGGYLVVKLLVVDSNNLTLVECYFQCSLLFLCGYMLEISLLGQSLCRVEQFAAADTCSPNTYVI